MGLSVGQLNGLQSFLQNMPQQQGAQSFAAQPDDPYFWGTNMGSKTPFPAWALTGLQDLHKIGMGPTPEEAAAAAAAAAAAKNKTVQPAARKSYEDVQMDRYRRGLSQHTSGPGWQPDWRGRQSER